MSETAHRAGLREWMGLVVLALPALVIALDFTALHLAVPHLSADLQPTSTEMLWIVDIYGFMIAGLLVAMGTLGDRIGRRRLLLVGGAAFGAASALAAFSSSTEMLIAARALLGITGATLLPSTLSLISNMFRDPVQRRFAIAVWSANFMLGGAIGPLVGGALLEMFWWGSVFLPAVPVMLLLILFGPLVVPEFRSGSAGRVDLVGVALAMASILPVVYGIKELAKVGPAAAPLLSIAAGALIGWVFVRRQRRLTDPLLDLALFSHRGFSVSLGAQTAGLFVLAATQFFLMQYLQLVLGLSPLRAGLWTVPAMAAGVAATLLVPFLTRRVRPVRVITGAFALAVAGLLIIAAAGSSGPALAVIGFTVLSFAVNPAMVLTYDMIIDSAPPERAGTASGTAETGNELGIALGVAIAGSIGAAVYRRQLTGEALPADTPPEVAEAARGTLGSAVAAAEELPGQVGEQLFAVARDAFMQGMRLTTIVLAVLLAGVAITVAALLRGTGAAAADRDGIADGGSGEDDGHSGGTEFSASTKSGEL
ncbi:DHA2 family multidrug resistance protein-like MFS transporter [Spinactinospora alkalitolerans]|uniref:DHA2 family multidrug resistance protein-like MFS transporter n=1 Tax=Spinactinospora alkalitolerans TaxID=687207 RepID=A0A852TX85_9ACTN|nr:MFS transporter [Spinactinospora alkalitolerans]NYE47443.1 DHA2 family multidrug resistance protein-like MFS transporter [Spinactinospora alkalitolerans]